MPRNTRSRWSDLRTRYKHTVEIGEIGSDPNTGKEFARQAANATATQAAVAGGIAAASVAAEAGTFDIAKNFMPAPKARLAATIVVAAGYTSMDIIDELVAYKSGKVSATEAAICASIKTVANAVPIVLQVVAGIAGATVGTIVSIGIKWGLRCIRKAAWNQAPAPA